VLGDTREFQAYPNYVIWEQMMNLPGPRKRTFASRVALRIAIAVGVACVLFLSPQAARADSTQTYNVTAVTTSGQTITGTLTIDFTTGLVTTGAGGIDVDGTMFSCPQAAKCHLRPASATSTVLRLVDGPSFLQFVWNNLQPGGPAPANLTLISSHSYCKFCEDGNVFQRFTSGSAAAIQTPEPAEGLMLLAGLGALGLLFLRQRKTLPNAQA
jgi:hypothetical protein